jgi:anti-repressor protein
MESINVSSVNNLNPLQSTDNTLMMAFEGIEVEIIELGEEYLFELYSSGMALGYAKVAKGLTYPRKERINSVTNSAGISTVVHHGQQYLTESDLFDFMLEARTEKCKPFRKWVTSEVLPSIRKHGGYLTERKIEEALTDPDTIIKLATNLKNEKLKRKSLEVESIENKPKVRYAEAVEVSETSILVGELARKLNENGLNIGQNRLFSWLRDNGYLIKGKRKDYNLPNQRSMELGIMEIKQTPRRQNGKIVLDRTPVITGKGQIYLINMLLPEFGLCEGGLI